MVKRRDLRSFESHLLEARQGFIDLLLPESPPLKFGQDTVMPDDSDGRPLSRVIGCKTDKILTQPAQECAFPDPVSIFIDIGIEPIPSLVLVSPEFLIGFDKLGIAGSQNGCDRSGFLDMR